jgi:hypothetical protein
LAEHSTLLEIYNKIWEREVFPKSWTEATVIPILKPGKNPNQTNMQNDGKNCKLQNGIRARERKEITYLTIWFQKRKINRRCSRYFGSRSTEGLERETTLDLGLSLLREGV